MQVDLNESPGDIDGIIVVTNYEYGYYEGSGEAIALTSDLQIQIYNLGHCSCYGPLEYGPCETFDSVEQFKERVSCVSSEVEAKFWELYNVHTI